jgi:hypothetical protein
MTLNAVALLLGGKYLVDQFLPRGATGRLDLRSPGHFTLSTLLVDQLQESASGSLSPVLRMPPSDTFPFLPLFDGVFALTYLLAANHPAASRIDA